MNAILEFQESYKKLIVFVYFSKIVLIFNIDIFVKVVQVPPRDWFEDFWDWVKFRRNAIDSMSYHFNL